MVNFFEVLGGLKARITDVAAAKVLGSPPGEIMVRAPAIQRGAEQQAAGDSKRQSGEIPEVRWLYWGDPTPEGGVTIFTTKQGFALLKDDAQMVRFQTAHRIARWVMSQPRWAASNSPRSQTSVVNEILCHASGLVNDPDMSVEYQVNSSQNVYCTVLGFPLENPSDGSPAPPDDVPV